MAFYVVGGWPPYNREESKDEKIRKALIAYFKHHKIGINIFYGVKGDDVIAWLEKQGDKDKVLVSKDQIESLHTAINEISKLIE